MYVRALLVYISIDATSQQPQTLIAPLQDQLAHYRAEGALRVLPLYRLLISHAKLSSYLPLHVPRGHLQHSVTAARQKTGSRLVSVTLLSMLYLEECSFEHRMLHFSGFKEES